MEMMEMKITDETFDEKVLEAERPMLVEFWASWCPPCKRMEPLLKELEKDYDGTIHISKINIDRNPATAERFDIKGVPTFIVFHEGEIIARDFGAKSKKQLRGMIERGLEKHDG